MGFPQHSSSFADVKEVIDFALANGGARYTLPAQGKATHWRQRFYYVRKLMRREFAQGNAGPIVTPYDNVILTVDPLDPSTVVVTINTAKGTLTALDGSRPKVAPINPLEAEAEDFNKRLRGLALDL